MNNHYFRVLLNEGDIQYTITIKSAKDLNDAASQAIRRAKRQGASNPTIGEVSEHLLTAPQANIDS
jgi:hypothetical protein